MIRYIINFMIIDRNNFEPIDTITRNALDIPAGTTPVIYNTDTSAFEIKVGMQITQRNFLRKLAELRYERNDYEERPGLFRVKGGSIKFIVPSGDASIRIEWSENKIETIYDETAEIGLEILNIFPAKHFVTPREKLELALSNIESELKEKISRFKF